MIEGIEGIQSVGILNAMKTGNVLIDMVIAMTIPVILGSMFSCLSYLQKQICEIDFKRYFTKQKNIYERTIKHSSMTSAYSKTDLGSSDSQNELLIKAIQLYLDHHNLLKLRRAEVELRQIDNDDSKSNSYYYYSYDEQDSTSLADTLAKYKIMKKPLKNIWLNVGKYPSIVSKKGKRNAKEDTINYDVNLIVTENQESIDEKDDGSSSLKHRSEIRLDFSSEGKESIDVFIDKAYNWYIAQLRTLEDDTRYLYELSLSKENDESNGSTRKYKRYQLSDEKTFESLFFKEKETILKVVDHFTNKTGKYSIKGYPHKLGLLLHGPPGTGKTSLIKALAHKTGRSIVNVPLARISTNAELASLFFDQKYCVEGERVPVKMNFKDVIFVMEDVDAVSKVVRRRDGKTSTSEFSNTSIKQVELPVSKSLWTMLLESNDNNSKELVELLVKKSDRLNAASKDSNLLSSVAQKIASVPGLSFVGENSEDETISKITSDAVTNAQALMTKYQTVDQFIGNHAMKLKQMIDSGVEVNEDFENELLGLSDSSDSIASSSSFVSLQKPASFTPPTNNSISQVSAPDNDTSSNDIAAAIEALNYEDDSPKAEKLDESTTGKIGPFKAPSSWKAKIDELNLTGLLNVLDGVVDTPGRMLVMTSNHPETLDPALIRPGRIDKKLFLGHLRYEDLVCMMEHYFQIQLDEEEVERVKVAINDTPSLKLTPAQVEQMACEFEEVEDMIKAIEMKKLTLV